MPKSSASLLFIFVAAVGTLLLATAVLNLSVQSRTSIEKNARPAALDAVSALPNTVGGAVRRLEIDATAEPLTLFAYREGGAQVLGLVRWDQRAGAYALNSRLELRGAQFSTKLPFLKVLPSGWGSGLTVEARWPLAADARYAVTHLQIDRQQLEQMVIQLPNGKSQLEMFEVGDTVSGAVELTVQDLDGDGVAELVQTSTNQDGDQTIDVFLWADGKLSWSRQWSQAMTARLNLFPDPEGEE